MVTRKRPISEASSEENSRQKKRRMTASQLDRKRELDREAQRSLRAKTKNRIEYLERIVKDLEANDDERVTRLLRQIDDQQVEIQRLRGIVNGISRLIDGSKSNITLPEPVSYKPAPESVASQRNVYEPPSPESFDSVLNEITVPSPLPEIPEIPDIPEISVMDCGSLPPINGSPETIELVERPELDGIPTDADLSLCHSQHQSIAQTAASICSRTGLDGRFWYLAGGLLNHLLSTCHESPMTSTFDEDIAIRAVFEGWSAVIERYPLDRGWQWLKELDERIYFHLPESHRLMHIRNTRLIFLRQTFNSLDRCEQAIPSFFAARPSQEFINHDPLVEHFPWPGFRERLLFSPSKYATNKFMDSLRFYVDFMWNQDAHDLYDKDPATGLYSYSEVVNSRLMDIRCYGAKQEFFDFFPELRADIPCSTPSPVGVFPLFTWTDAPASCAIVEEDEDKEAEPVGAVQPWTLRPWLLTRRVSA